MSTAEQKEKTGATVGDLIEVPQIRTVIQLLDARSENRDTAREIAETFVITEEIEGYLREFLEAMARPSGAGAFLKGHYGSGKSHFLSYLSMVIEGDTGGITLTEPLREALEKLGGKRCFTVLIPLFLFNAGESLEEIVLITCQKALGAALKKTVNLSRSAMLLESFNTYILPREAGFLKGLSLTGEGWRSLCAGSPHAAAEKALAYLESLPSNPLSLHYDRREAFGTMNKLLRSHGYHGLVLIIDELSEFLRAKPSAREFNEDIRALQFMGEWSAHEPLWIICSLQEQIEDVGYIEQDMFRRIKDRYSLRFSLSTRHIESLIEKRVLIKRQGSRAAIDGIFRKLLGSFPHLTLTSEYFYKIYPVHPATLAMLEHLMGLFSQHRGIVDFLRTAVGGDRRRGMPSLLEEPSDRLLTCDAIFDHFQEKIRETVETAPYYTVAYRSLEEDIGRIFEKERDRKMALKMVKIMILSELSPLEKRKSARELADLAVERVSALDASVNYDYAREVILDRLVRESGYVAREQAPQEDAPRYYINLTANVASLVQKKTREVLRTIEMDSVTWRAILSMVNVTSLPLKEHLEGKSGPRRIYMKWDCTAREGWLLPGDLTEVMPGELEHLEGTLRGSEQDFIILMGFPGGSEAQWRHLQDLFTYVKSSPYAGAIMGWVPAAPDARELEALSVTYAHVLMRGRLTDSPEDRETAAHLDELAGKEQAYLREIITSLYFKGSLLSATGEVPLSPKDLEHLHFSRLVQQLLTGAFEALYPRHREVRPLSDGYNQAMLEKASALLFQGSRLPAREAEEKGVTATIESAMVPMGLVKRSQSSYAVTADPSKTPFLAELLSYLIAGKPAPLDTIYMKMRKGPFGVIRPLFNTAVAFLIHTGLLTPYNGLIVTAAPSLKKLFSFEINAVGEGRLIDRELQDYLGAASFLWGSETETLPLTMVTQRILWDKAAATLKALSEKMKRLRETLAHVKSYSVAALLPMGDLESATALMEDFLAAVPLSADSKRGLELILGEIRERPEIPEACLKVEKHLAFLSGDFEVLQRLHGYLANPMLSIPGEGTWGKLAERKARSQDLLSRAGEAITRGEAGGLFSEVQLFIKEYQDHYCDAHEAYYRHPHFQEWEAIAGSREYAVLRRLSRLYGLEVAHDIIRIQQLMNDLPRQCCRMVREELALGVRCSCGYRLGDELRGMPPDTLNSLMLEGIEEYCRCLHEGPQREKIELYAAGLRDAGKREQAAVLAKLLAPGPPAVKEALALFSEDVIELIYRALFTKIQTVERDIDKLCDDLKGRRFTPGRLREHIERWLDLPDLPAAGGEELYLHVVSPRSDDRFSLWEGYDAVRAVVREEGRRFLPAFYSALFLHRHGLAEDSAFLATRFKIDRGRLEAVERAGREALEVQNRYDDVLRAEKTLIEEGEAEELMAETGVDRCDTEGLMHFLRRGMAFPFMARRAGERLLSFYSSLDELPQIDGALSLLEKHCTPYEMCWGEAPFLGSWLRVKGKILESEGVDRQEPLDEFRTVIAPLAYSLEELRSYQFRCELLSEGAWRSLERQVRQIQKDHRERFHDFVSRGLAPSLKDFASRVFAPLRRRNRRAPAFIVIFDGMRLDLWRFLEPLFAEILPSHTKDEQCLVAAVPSDTATNRPWLLGAPAGACEGTLGSEAFTLVKASEKAVKRGTLDELIKNDVPLKVLHFNFIDDRLHHCDTPLPELYEGLRSEFLGTVAPHLKKLPRESLVMLVSDHGFEYTFGKKSPYRHGGDSPQERVVPCVSFLPCP
ncbi:MAG: DUF6079 family protein [Candidatus Eremiobacteraeota bacterium]|nr:DUF6079 family protein [Candidatus Eremiobacteraeota bacterium]